MAVGFRCWNSFQREIRHLRQLYDFTAHLYAQENEKLAHQSVPRYTTKNFHTSIGAITHNVNRLVSDTAGRYPEKLRELLLVLAVTFLETYLSELIREISERTIEPFLTHSPLEMQKSHVLAATSIDVLREEVIAKEIRQLTNAGLTEFEKFYRNRLGLDFGVLGIPIGKIREIHERRHLHVHRSGICDEQYAHKYPNSGFAEGDLVAVDQAYLLASLTLLMQFAATLRNSALALYPERAGAKRSAQGRLAPPKTVKRPLLIRAEVRGKKLDVIAEVPKLDVSGTKVPNAIVADFLYRIVRERDQVDIMIGASDKEVRGIMHAIRSYAGIRVLSVTPAFE